MCMCVCARARGSRENLRVYFHFTLRILPSLEGNLIAPHRSSLRSTFSHAIGGYLNIPTATNSIFSSALWLVMRR